MHTICLTYDFDAVAAWIAAGRQQFASWGVFGAETATPRLLDLHDRLDIPSTWFVPGHTAESFPEVTARIADEGHEIAHHGWSHEPLPTMSAEAERADFERGLDALESVTGEVPTGFRAPDGGFSSHTIGLLEEYGFVWDSSEGIDEFHPYYLRRQPSVEPGELYSPGEKTDIVEVPVIWHRDDWMQLFPVVSGPEWVAYTNEPAVFERWRCELEWMCSNCSEAVFTLLLHPQCAGRAPFLTHFEDFLTDMQGRSDIRFGTGGEIATALA